MRDLTFHTDKLRAIVGIAYFIQKGTNFELASGLWMETLPFNLLWTLVELPKDRPDRPVPTWSWASVDGRISHGLKIPPTKAPRATWKGVNILMSRTGVKPILESTPAIPKGTLRLDCYVCSLDLKKVNFIPDIALEHTAEGLICLPILSFKNTYIYPCKRRLQVHGIVLRANPRAVAEYERIGYFWTADKTMTREILASLGMRCIIRIV
jgi:hypothetical protein